MSTSYLPSQNPNTYATAAAAQQAVQNVGSNSSVQLPASKQGLGTKAIVQQNLQETLSALEVFHSSPDESSKESLSSKLQTLIGDVKTTGSYDDAKSLATDLSSALQKGDFEGVSKSLDTVLKKVGDASHSADAQKFTDALKTQLASEGQTFSGASESSTQPASQNNPSTSSTGAIGNPFAPPKTYDWQAMADAYKKPSGT